jgi:hypothetical protein
LATGAVLAPGAVVLATAAPELGITAGAFWDWGVGPAFISGVVVGTLVFAVKELAGACNAGIAVVPALL